MGEHEEDHEEDHEQKPRRAKNIFHLDILDDGWARSVFRHTPGVDVSGTEPPDSVLPTDETVNVDEPAEGAQPDLTTDIEVDLTAENEPAKLANPPTTT